MSTTGAMNVAPTISASVRIFGLDFTSAPSRKKPITVASCVLQNTLLTIESYIALENFPQFEQFLQQDGPWLAACDFPFGQPLKLINNLGWPPTWEGYVQHIAAMGKQGFEETITHYREARPAGDKLHLRITDRLAGGSCSPMMLHRIPVGKMFFQGAPRLLASGVCVLPCHPVDDNRIVVEGYPALVARHWSSRKSYKSDERAKQTSQQQEVRQKIVNGICSEALQDLYGVKLRISDEQAEQLVQEPMGDMLDAVLCAIQAGWVYTQRNNGYGIPVGHEVEGWIADPSLSISVLDKSNRPQET